MRVNVSLTVRVIVYVCESMRVSMCERDFV